MSRLKHLSSWESVAQNRKQTINHFDNLPDEMLYEIFSKVSQVHLFALAKVSRRFHRVCNEERLWTNIYLAGQTIAFALLEQLITGSFFPIKKLNLKCAKVTGYLDAKSSDSYTTTGHITLDKLDMSYYGEGNIQENEEVFYVLNSFRTKELIWDKPCTYQDPELMEAISKHRGLEVLSMRYSDFSKFVQAADFEKLLMACNRLKKLDLTGCTLRAQQIRAVCHSIPETVEKLMLVEVSEDLGRSRSALVGIAESYEILFRRAKNLKYFGAPFEHFKQPAVMRSMIQHQSLETLCLGDYDLYARDFDRVLGRLVQKVRKIDIFFRYINQGVPAQLDKVREAFNGIDVKAIKGLSF